MKEHLYTLQEIRNIINHEYESMNVYKALDAAYGVSWVQRLLESLQDNKECDNE